MRPKSLSLVPPNASEGGAPQRAESTLAASALAKVLALINSGELPPGATINEKYLAERFSMSRGPVREAVRTLEGRKLVTRTAFKRARVIALDKTEIKEVFEFRQSLEVTACRLATRVMTDEQIQELAAKSVSPAGAPQPFSWRPFHFHQAIVEACGNSRIQAALGPDLYVLVGLYSRASQRAVTGEFLGGEGHWSPPNPAARPSVSDQEHWQIARAMLARDEELAESLMRAHIGRVMGTVVANAG